MSLSCDRVIVIVLWLKVLNSFKDVKYLSGLDNKALCEDTGMLC